MVCPSCGVEVSVGQPFCNGCGASLRGVTDPTERVETIERPDAQPIETIEQPDTELIETIVQPDTQPIDLAAVTTEVFAPPTTPPVATRELPVAGPAVFDGLDDVREFPPERERFRVRVIFVASFLGAVAALMAAVGDVVDIRTSRPTAGITSGMYGLDDVATNLGPSAVGGAAVMVVGALFACFGFRWASGLAGGAGLALAGWAALTIGLVEVPIATAESITRTSPEAFTLTVTRDAGWWLVVAVGAIGAIVFVASLGSLRRAGQRYLNPLIAGTGAVCLLVLAAGPLVPVGTATWRDNVRSPTAAIDLPTVFFAGRLAQVGLIAFVGVVGFLIVRAYGLGLAAGGISVATWLWVTSLLEIGDRPTGVAARNPGAVDTVPHAVTTVGMIASIVCVVIAVIIAVVTRLTTPANAPMS